PLRTRSVIEQTEETRALDWYAVEGAGKPYRWSGPNPRPRLLIPFTGGRARVALEVRRTELRGWTKDLSLFVESEKVAFMMLERGQLPDPLVAEINLSPVDYTVLTLETPMFCPRDQSGSADARRLGIAVADIVIEPL